MTGHPKQVGSDSRLTMRRACTGLGALALAVLLATSALAQTVQQQAPDGTAAGPPTTPESSARPGLFDVLGRWFSEPKALFDRQLKTTGDALGSATDAAKDAAGAIVTLPGTRVVTGRQLCPAAANSAPDCSLGAEALCRGKGFGAGRQLDIRTAETCRPRIRLADRPRLERNCSTETFVTRAVCQ